MTCPQNTSRQFDLTTTGSARRRMSTSFGKKLQSYLDGFAAYFSQVSLKTWFGSLQFFFLIITGSKCACDGKEPSKMVEVASFRHIEHFFVPRRFLLRLWPSADEPPFFCFRDRVCATPTPRLSREAGMIAMFEKQVSSVATALKGDEKQDRV